MHSSSVGVSELFSIGIGPSSSHTVGPMRAAAAFTDRLSDAGLSGIVTSIDVRLRGSLGATGMGHGTPAAVVAGLRGMLPETCDPVEVAEAWSPQSTGAPIALPDGRDLVPIGMEFAPMERHPGHANAVTFVAYGAAGEVLADDTYLSTGGGFIVRDGEASVGAEQTAALPWQFTTFDDLLECCAHSGLSVADVMRDNERARGVDADALCAAIWTAMNDCVTAGRSALPGLLPGGLRVRRRAPGLAIRAAHETGWQGEIARIQADALAVNEENASGGRVVTAPTNGAAGILPAVIAHHVRADGAEAAIDMLLTAAAIGAIVLTTASISGAQVGCQGEVGSACAMAAGALCAALGGSPEEVGRAAEIGLEHHLGLTCDPVGGLVQIPCIERNAIAAVTAVQSALLVRNEPDHISRVSLDTVIRTMKAVGADMLDKYKETAQGGLALSVVEC